jgi:tRNA-modifying protein YgfZ
VSQHPEIPVADEPLSAGVARRDAGVVEVVGADRADFLHNVLSQDVLGMGDDEVRSALHLDQHGAPLAALDVVVLPGRTLLVLPTVELAREEAEFLGSRTFLADARLTTTDLVVRSLRGERARDVAVRAGLDAEPGHTVEDDGVVVLGRRDGIDLLAAAGDTDEAVSRLVAAGAVEVTPEVLEAWRIETGEPAWAREIRRPHLPEEAGVLPSHVHLDKGCYPGQEAVARMWMLGRPRRRLARVHLAGEIAPGHVAGSGRDQVEVTSAAVYDDRRVGLAYVPPAASPGDRLDDGRIVVRDLVGEGPVPGQEEGVVRRRDRRAAGA